jgi:hypothetical protein
MEQNTMDLLKQELMKRFEADKAKEAKLSELIDFQQGAAENIPLEYRRDMTPTLNFAGQLTGTDLARGYERPENLQEGLRKALAYKMQQRRPDPMSALKGLAGLEAAELKAAKGSGPRQLSAKDVMTVQEGENIPMMLQDVEKVIQANADIFGPVEGRLHSANPWDTQGRTVDAQIRAASQAFGRYMEGGVLRKEDEEKYRRMFPNLSDTPSVAASKLDVVKRLMQQRQAGNLQALSGAGFDTSMFAGGGQGAPIAGMSGNPNVFDPGQMSDQELDAMIARLSKGR